MSNALLQKSLRYAMFTAAAVSSALVTGTVLRSPLGRSIFGLFLLVCVVGAILYACSWYLRTLWTLSGRFSLAMAALAFNAVPSASQPTEQSR